MNQDATELTEQYMERLKRWGVVYLKYGPVGDDIPEYGRPVCYKQGLTVEIQEAWNTLAETTDNPV
jgi:hypothetical protein